MAFSFFGGIHPKDRKALAREHAITPFPPPATVVIPMSQHIGVPCKPLVSKGDHVDLGQKIGDGDGLCVPVHASVSGTVQAVEARPHPNGTTVLSVVIANDFQETVCPDITRRASISGLSAQDLIRIIREAGIVGMGGATFPTDVKLSSGVGKVDTVIVNASECEPYITSDNRCFIEDTHHVLNGIKQVMKYLNIAKCVIGIEGNKPDAIAKMQSAIDVAGIEVKQLPCRYPQGAEKVLIETCTGREVPFPGLPSDVGVILMNVTSTAFVGKYLETGMPLTTKRLTVDGDIVKQPKNVEVIIGTPIQELLDFCGGLTAEPGKILYGGPMMGTCVADLSQPILKNNNAILAFFQERAKLPKASNCIQCGRCVNACPLGLAAKDIVVAFNKGNVELLNQLHADLCMSCGTCSFVCPAKRPLTPSIALAKIMMKNGGKK